MSFSWLALFFIIITLTLILSSQSASAQPMNQTKVPILVKSWGSAGYGNGQFAGPRDIATDSFGNVYVADSFNFRIQKFTSNGTIITKWGSKGTADGQFNFPFDIAIDSLNNVYVLDYFNLRIQKFTSNGTFITKWGSNGTGDGQFSWPFVIATDSHGNLYVVDNGNYRIEKFTGNGTFLENFWSGGNKQSQLTLPSGMAIDSVGNIYVINDQINSTIKKFTSDGIMTKQWDSQRIREGMVTQLTDITVSSLGDLYANDVGFSQVERFTSNGTLISEWGIGGKGASGLPFSISADPQGNVYVLDVNGRVSKFSYATELLSTVNKKFLVPQKQIANGVLPENIKCNEGLLWIRELSTKSVACVNPITGQRLVEWGWGTMLTTENNTPIILPNMMKIKNTDFFIQYSITAGKVAQAIQDRGSFSLVISVQSPSDGKLIVKIPRPIFGTTVHGKELYFNILSDGQETDFQHVKTVGLDRTEIIPFKQGSHDIEFVQVISGY